MRILDRYVGRNVAFSILLVSLFLTVIAAIITFIDQTRYIGRGSIDFLFLVQYLIIQIPGIVVMTFPIAVLLGGVVALGNLARTSEITILMSLGISRAGVVFSALKTVFPMILIVIFIGETAVPALNRIGENRYNESAHQGNLAITYDGLWLKEGSSFLAARYIMTDGSISGVVRYDFEGQVLKSVSYSRTGHYDTNLSRWVMKDVETTVYDEAAVVSTHEDEAYWDLSLNPERMEILGDKFYNLTITGLVDYITYLESNNQRANNYRLQLYLKLMMPFTMVVMLLLAASTVFGTLRSISMGARIVLGIAMGFFFYVINSVGAPFALVYGLPPLLGAALPTLLFFVLALWLLNRGTPLKKVLELLPYKKNSQVPYVRS